MAEGAVGRSQERAAAVVQMPRAEESGGDATVQRPEVEEDGDDCVARTTRSKTHDSGAAAETIKSDKDVVGVLVKQEGKRGRGRPKGSKNRPAEGDDSMVVKEEKGCPGRPKRIRPAEEDGSQDCGREAKKVVQRWTPANSIMQRWISSAQVQG